MKTFLNNNMNFNCKREYYDTLFRKKLRAVLKYKGLSQKEFAFLCNKKSQNATSRWMTMNQKYKTSPNAAELLAMCCILKIHISYFFEVELSCKDADISKKDKNNAYS